MNSSIGERIQKSSVRLALDEIGDRWTLLILIGAFLGLDRFDLWMRRYDMSSSVLSNRLQRLKKNGLLEMARIESSRRSRYILTEKGQALFVWALAAWKWENTWIYQSEGHPLSLIHKTCGQAFVPNFLCRACDKAVRWADIEMKDVSSLDKTTESSAPAVRRSNITANRGEGGQDIGRVLDMLGDRWSNLIVSAALYGIKRFDAFQNELNIAPSILSDRLKRLSEHGILARSLYQRNPTRWEYILTEKILDFSIVPLMLDLWGDKWLQSGAGGVLLRRHDLCGQPLDVKVVCNFCSKEVSHAVVEFMERPAKAGD